MECQESTIGRIDGTESVFVEKNDKTIAVSFEYFSFKSMYR